MGRAGIPALSLLKGLMKPLRKAITEASPSQPVNSTANLLAYSIAANARTRRDVESGVKPNDVSHGAAQKRVSPNVLRASAANVMTQIAEATEKVLAARRLRKRPQPSR